MYHTSQIVLLASGASAKPYIDFIQSSKLFVVAVNFAALHYPADIMFTLDNRDIYRRVFALPLQMQKVVAVKNQTIRLRLPADYNVLTIPRNPKSPCAHSAPPLSKDYVRTGNSAVGAVEYIVTHFSPKRVFLFGCDCTQGYAYWYEQQQPQQPTPYPDATVINFWRALSHEVPSQCRIYNVSPTSLLPENVFPRIDIKEFINILSKEG